MPCSAQPDSHESKQAVTALVSATIQKVIRGAGKHLPAGHLLDYSILTVLFLASIFAALAWKTDSVRGE
jgi:hypothetical protein